MTHRIRVLVPVPIEAGGGGVYDYLTGDMSVGIGDYVAVPLGKRVVPGVVWDVPHGAADNDLPLDRLKQIQQRYDVPPMGAV